MRWATGWIAALLTLCASPSSAGLFQLETVLQIEIAGIGVVTSTASGLFAAQSDGVGGFADNTVQDYSFGTTLPISPPLLGVVTAARFGDVSPGAGQFDSPPLGIFPLVNGTFGGPNDLSGFPLQFFAGGTTAGTIALSIVGNGGTENPVTLPGLFVATVIGLGLLGQWLRGIWTQRAAA